MLYQHEHSTSACCTCSILNLRQKTRIDSPYGFVIDINVANIWNNHESFNSRDYRSYEIFHDSQKIAISTLAKKLQSLKGKSCDNRIITSH
jgi:hypothetical protein